MIKKYWEITLRDYDIMEKTGNVSQFRSTWNILPIVFFNKKIAGLVEILIEKINDNSDKNEKTEDAIWQFESLNNINAIRANYMGLLHVLKYQPELNSLKQFYQKYTRKKLKIRNSNQFKIYAKGIKDLTGIEVKTFEDVKKVRKLLEFKTDKYNENFKLEVDKEKSNIYLMGIALGVYSRLNVSFNPSQITIIEFIEAKNKALEINRAAKSKR